MSEDYFLSSYYAFKYLSFQYFLFRFYSDIFEKTFSSLIAFCICGLFEIAYTLSNLMLFYGLFRNEVGANLRFKRITVLSTEAFLLMCLVALFFVAGSSSSTSGDNLVGLLWYTMIIGILFGLSLIFSLVPFNNELS